MLKEALEKIQEMAVGASREVGRTENLRSIMTVKDYGAYSERELDAYFEETEDEGGRYEVNRPKQKTESVSNIDSFIAAVIEESRRLENKTANRMTVSFSQNGGKYQPDCDLETKGIIYNYNRKFSNQWKIVRSLISGNYVNHFDLIQSLQSLKPSLVEGMNAVNYLKLMSYYSKLKLNSSSELTSQPMFNNEGELGEGYTVQFTLKSGAQTEEQYLPTKLQLKLPYVKNSDKLYDLELEISIVKNGRDEFAARFLCPEFEEVEEQAMKDEIQKFKDAMLDASLTDLLIVESF